MKWRNETLQGDILENNELRLIKIKHEYSVSKRTTTDGGFKIE